MKIRQDQLSATLNKELAPVYLISGDDPLLLMEACDDIRAAARKAGIDERELFHAEGNFDWSHLRDEASAMSLFASRRVLEVRIPNGKPSDKGATLLELINNPNPDNLLLLVCPRLDSTQQKTAWVKAAEKQGVWLPVWPIERHDYPGWLKRRLQQAGLQIEPAALALLAQQTEGNLLAAVQEIEKLRLLGTRSINEELVQQAIGDSSRFDAFALADACLLGHLAEAVRMLNHLRAEGVEAIMILGALLRKIRQLLALKPLSGQQLSEAFSKQKIWPKQQGPFKKALQNLSQPQLEQALLLAEKVDQAVKGSGEDPWRLLSELVVVLTNVKLPTG